MVTAAGAIALAFAGDILFEEYPEPVHPVALFGRAVGWVDRSWSHPTIVGIAAALLLPLLAGGLAALLTAASLAVSPLFGTVVAALVLFATVSLRMLVSVATEVIDATEMDPEAAREAVSALVGRKTAALSPATLRSAAVESAAENLTDGLVAPLLAFAVGAQLSLSVAVGAAVWVKAVNTLDSMLGYHSKPVGWASARLDDVVMWLPARLTAVLIALAGAAPGALRRARAWQDDPPSPNSGWPMATLAAVLDVRLEKPGVYVLNPDAALPTVSAARRGIRIVGAAGVLAFLLAAFVSSAAPIIEVIV